MSLPKFNLSKLKESVSRQQKAAKQDIRNLLLLDRLQSDISKQTKKSKSKSGEKYKVTIVGYEYLFNDQKVDYDVEFIKYIGSKYIENVTIKIDDTLPFREDYEGDAFRGEIEKAIKEPTLLDNLEYFEKTHLLEDKTLNSWEISIDNVDKMLGAVPDLIADAPYKRIEIERI